MYYPVFSCMKTHVLFDCKLLTKQSRDSSQSKGPAVRRREDSHQQCFDHTTFQIPVQGNDWSPTTSKYLHTFDQQSITSLILQSSNQFHSNFIHVIALQFIKTEQTRQLHLETYSILTCLVLFLLSMFNSCQI